MSRIAYVDGRYVPHADAAVHVEDRGYQFADGVYEVIGVHRGRLFDAEPHLDRLDRSLDELRIAAPMGRRAMRVVLAEMLRRNRITGAGAVYLQVTRGVAPRAHAFPARARPVLVMTARSMPPFDPKAARRGVAVVTMPDIRWGRCDIKSVSLLANVLGKQSAIEAGAFDAWMVDDTRTITEGTASNAWIVTRKGELITRQPDHAILNGITRRAVLALAAELGIKLVERPFTVAQAKKATEAFLTSTTSMVKPVVRIDGTKIGSGRIGPLTARLVEFYARHLDDEADAQAPDHRP